MSDDNIPHTKFTGRTYGRPKICQASQVFDEIVSSEIANVTVKECESFWDKTSSFSERESLGIVSVPKKGRMDGDDFFSFDNVERKSKPMKMQRKLQEQKPHTQKAEMAPLQSYSRRSPHNVVTTASFCESGEQTLSEQPVCLSKARLVATYLDGEEPNTLKTYSKEVIPDEKSNSLLLKKYRRRKQRKARDRRHLTVCEPALIEDYDTSSTNKHLTETLNPSQDLSNESAVLPKPELANEDQGTTVPVYKLKRQLEKGEGQAKYFHGSSKCIVKFTEAASNLSSQDGLSLNYSNDSISSSTVIAEVVTARTGTENVLYTEDNSSERISSLEGVSTYGSSDSISSTTVTTEEITSRTGTQPQNVLFTEDNSSERMLSPISNSSNILSPTSTKCISNTGDSSTCRVESTRPLQTLSHGNSLIDMSLMSQGPVRKQYRIFKSRSTQIEEIEKLQAPNFRRKEHDDSSLPNRKLVINANGDSQAIYQEDEGVTRTPVQGNLLSSSASTTSSQTSNSAASTTSSQTSNSAASTTSSQTSNSAASTTSSQTSNSAASTTSSQTSNSAASTTSSQTSNSAASTTSSQTSNSAEPTDAVKYKLNTVYDQNDFSPARESQLNYMEQDKDSESTSVLGNVSERSEPTSSQEAPSNSQKSLERKSRKKNPAVTAWKFFKSKKALSESLDLQRGILVSSPQKFTAKASYNMRSWNSDHEADIEEETAKITKKKDDDAADVVILQKSEEGPRLKREMHWPVGIHDEAYTKLTVSKSHKELYTVIQNVRQTHEVQELGETHDFIKEIDYLLESLKETNSTTIRCLSCLKLASKCISPAFRMHMRVHGTVSRIFNLLEDACSDPSLALSTSAIMFMLSRDRLSMDLDHHSLNLMLKLNENDAGGKASPDVSGVRGLEKTRQKVKELLGQLQETYDREVDLDFVSTSSLALESLLSLTSRRAGELFKQELRSVGGLDHIVDSVRFCEKILPENLSRNIQKSLPVLRKLNRCLRVLENISYMNSENQNYLLLYKNSVLLQSCSRTLRLCQLCLPTFKLPENLDRSKAVKDFPGHTVLTCMLNVLMVMINITHDNRLTNLNAAEKVSLMETVVKCLTMTPWCIPVEQRFDMAVQCLVLLTNLVEHHEGNRTILMEMRTQVRHAPQSQSRRVSAVSAVVELFVQKEEAAREMEEEIESISDTSTPPSPRFSGEQKEADTSVQRVTRKQKREQKDQKTLTCGTPTGESIEEHQGDHSILEDGEETFTKALHKAGRHMENSIVAAYVGILLGSLIADNKEYTSVVKKLLPNEDFGPMVTVLNKFLSFMVLVTAYEHADVKLIERVIGVLKSA